MKLAVKKAKTKEESSDKKTTVTYSGQDFPSKVRVEIEVGLSKNYNSLKMRVGGEVPFHVDGDDLDANLEALTRAVNKAAAALEEVVEEKVQEMQDALGG